MLGSSEAQRAPHASHAHAGDDFNPYVDNGGTVIAIAGPDFALVAGDTRLSEQYSTLSRREPKICELGGGVLLASAGMHADRQRLWKQLKLEAAEYSQASGRPLGVAQAGSLVGRTLYNRRFMPFYTFNLVAGIDESGRGVTYGYDAVGSTTTRRYGAAGSGEELIIGAMDDALLPRISREHHHCDLGLEEAVTLVQTWMRAVNERDIHTGDHCGILIATPGGRVESRGFDLRKD